MLVVFLSFAGTYLAVYLGPVGDYLFCCSFALCGKATCVWHPVAGMAFVEKGSMTVGLFFLSPTDLGGGAGEPMYFAWFRANNSHF